ncbi:MAG: GNAT family N-acetyltransferase [bacterium]|nr:GNAT family N-acetyltransferase [bacterium]
MRPYSPADRAAVRQICCDTGYTGSPIDPVFTDRDVFADFFTRYYTDYEPESCLVAEDQGRIVGYLLGCTRYRYHNWMEKFVLLFLVTPKVLWRLATGRYNRASRNFLWWCCTKGASETPKAPSQAAHLHFNILPEYRNSGIGRRLAFDFFKILKARNVTRLYGQIQTYEDRRPPRIFERYGFIEYDRKEMTKYRELQETKVFCTTLFKEFTDE